MSAQRPSQEGSQVRVPAPPSALVQQPSEELRRLGEALHARSEEVVSRTVAQTIDSGEALDAIVQDSFEEIGTVSTVAVARWIAGDGLEVTYDASSKSSRIFGELAAHRAAS